MKTEVEFRGLRKDGEGFVYGDRVQGSSGKVYIFDYDDIVGNSHIHEVILESVGQFTGLKDKNGVKVFDGDKLEYLGAKGTVYYELSHAMFMVSFGISNSVYSFDSMDNPYLVIGNIHEPCKQY